MKVLFFYCKIDRVKHTMTHNDENVNIWTQETG